MNEMLLPNTKLALLMILIHDQKILEVYALLHCIELTRIESFILATQCGLSQPLAILHQFVNQA